MQAAYIEQTGAPEVIKVGDLPRPEPGPGQVLVRVHAAGLNPIDLYIRSGLVAMPMSFPYIIACDLAGHGREGRAELHAVPGRAIASGARTRGCSAARAWPSEYAAVDEAWLYPTPALLPDAEAAAMALVGITAHLGLFQFGQLKPGEIVYVPGGTGGVGSMVVQMAKAAGARVATAAGSPEKLEVCRRLGADLALNYKTDDIPGRLREFSPEGIDVWYETQREPNLEVSIPLLRKNGRMILMAGRDRQARPAPGRLLPPELRLFGFAMFNATPEQQRRCAVDIIRWIEEGQLKAARRPHLPPVRRRRSPPLPRGEHPQGRGLARSGRSCSRSASSSGSGR